MTIQEKCNKLNQDIHKPIFLNNYLKINSKNHEKAGHPADRKNGKEFYFIHKGANSKYDFSYAGYTPEFKSVDVDLKQFIKEQNHFTETVLDEVEKSISAQVQEDKEKFNSIKLVEIFGDLNYPINLISRAILNDYPNAMLGLGQIQESLKKLKIELNKRYNNECAKQS